jgi:phosphopantetheine--protein transferase-like protein
VKTFTLPHGMVAAVAVGDLPLTLPGLAALEIPTALSGLHPDEAAHAITLAPARQRDWIAGRLALRGALGSAGLACEAPVLIDDRGAPALTGGAVGSISHKRGLAVALAAPADGNARVGIDIELLGAARLDVSARVLTDPERASIASLSAEDRARAVTLRFALKEAIYKAIDPFLRRYVGFREVEVWPEEGRARVDTGALAVAIDAAWIQIGDVVICSARATASG